MVKYTGENIFWFGRDLRHDVNVTSEKKHRTELIIHANAETDLQHLPAFASVV